MVHGALTLMLRSLRRDARLRRSHAFRIASLLLLCGMLILAHVTGFAVGAPGLRFFRSICFLNFGLITLAGFSFFSSAITEEKEEGTLGLLKLADLSTLSILLGKSTTRLFTALLVFVAQFPFALLALTLGGVTAHQVWAAYVALAAYMVLVANVALLCSVVARRSGTAAVWMLLLSLTFLGLPPLLTYLRAGLPASGVFADSFAEASAIWRGVEFLQDTSVLTRLDEILTTGFNRSAFGIQVLLSVIVAVICFCAAWALFDRFTESFEPSAEADRPFSLPGRRNKRSVRPWKWALVWKDFRFVAGGPVVTAGKLVVYPLLVVGFWRLWDVRLLRAMGPSFNDVLWFPALVIIAAELLLYAARIFHQERMAGTWPVLAMLPRGAASLAYAKLCGCLLGSIPTVLLIVLLSAIVPPAGGYWIEPLQLSLSVGGLLVLLHLTALYSLIVRWGALPLALATLLILGTCLSPVLAVSLAAVQSASGSAAADLGPILYTTGVICAALQFLIGVRLRAAAAE